MKKIELEIEETLYDFYSKVGAAASKTTGQVLCDVLAKFAGDVCAELCAAKKGY